ncbi:alpha/beta hydrolase [Aliifodinibius salicampi]|uniref:Alpha/beta hydrolase n=1 Tax=Fodinibius salicampi TaxID=1920655 RepID=A0ABT3PUQ7_9BACT|nr:alpha/beta hydrolase [Fodinibius salicampi]MCW9711577.1 alpha/beta hydrolase [Fodinibius salicampi]
MMNPVRSTHEKEKQTSANRNRTQLTAALPVTEHQLNLSGVSTAVLIGGEGSPMILLHGPGESSVWWMRVIPKLIKDNRVIVPDLPGHGESKVNKGFLDTGLVFDWLSDLIKQTCPSPPILVGNILGGSIGVRFAVNHGNQISRLVLVNSLGLGKFRPKPSFAFRLMRFMLWPTEKNFSRFFPHCMYDVDNLRQGMGKYWDPFVAYNLECARDKERSDALQFMMKNLGIPKIPDKELQRINVPTALIWGRHDKANKLKIAQAASKKFGWPLQVIEETRDDPKLERPNAFTNALHNLINNSSSS